MVLSIRGRTRYRRVRALSFTGRKITTPGVLIIATFERGRFFIPHTSKNVYLWGRRFGRDVVEFTLRSGVTRFGHFGFALVRPLQRSSSHRQIRPRRTPPDVVVALVNERMLQVYSCAADRASPDDGVTKPPFWSTTTRRCPAYCRPRPAGGE